MLIHLSSIALLPYNRERSYYNSWNKNMLIYYNFISLPQYFDHLLQLLEHESTHAVISSPAKSFKKFHKRIIIHTSKGLFDNCFFKELLCTSK